MKSISRRQFLKSSSGAAIGAGLGAGCATTPKPVEVAKKAPAAVAAPATGRVIGANDRINIGIVGVAGRGMSHVQWLNGQKDVRITAMCDLYRPHLDKAIASTPSKPRGFSDYRKMLEMPELDAVFVVTPPHWHPLIAIAACQAGKDVYCEKPLALTPGESLAVVKAARANNRVTQVGTQIHASSNYHKVVEIVRSGILGPISCVRTGLALNEAPDGIGSPPDTPPPAGLDWDMWCGPLPLTPFNEARFKAGQHRYFADLDGSWLHEMGPHIIDLPVWALELGQPLSASAVGGKFVTKDISTIPDTLEAVFEYPGMIMTWSNSCGNSFGQAFQKPGKNNLTRRLGIIFQGTKATLCADYDEYWIVPEGDRLDGVQIPAPDVGKIPEHPREFLEAIRSRTLPSCDVEKHLPLAIALNLGNLSYKIGRKVHWDAQTGQIANDPEANALVTPEYRKPWVLPA
ncbi:MAG: Gfo/Idh/MocA family oxidoreductase [Candidatus Hydrogenedentales bacterium]|jgi:predicted dehydrogenase